MAHTPDEVRERIYLPQPGNVYDRWTAISEQVYGAALRGALLLPRDEFMTAIKEIKPIIIYCRPPDHVLDVNLAFQEVKPHKDLSFIKSIVDNRRQIRAVYDALMLAAPALGCLVVHYDYTKHGSPV